MSRRCDRLGASCLSIRLDHDIISASVASRPREPLHLDTETMALFVFCSDETDVDIIWRDSRTIHGVFYSAIKCREKLESRVEAV
jgi:hypothetical protein